MFKYIYSSNLTMFKYYLCSGSQVLLQNNTNWVIITKVDHLVGIYLIWVYLIMAT